MAEELDRKILPEFLQTTFSISLGAAFKSWEMMLSPVQSFKTMMSEMGSLLTIPPDAGEGLQKKAEAIAGTWMEKGANLMQVCRTAGERFTEGK